MENKEKTIFALRLILLVVLIIFLISFLGTIKTDCEACSFLVKGEQLSAVEFFDEYSLECFAPKQWGDQEVKIPTG